MCQSKSWISLNKSKDGKTPLSDIWEKCTSYGTSICTLGFSTFFPRSLYICLETHPHCSHFDVQLLCLSLIGKCSTCMHSVTNYWPICVNICYATWPPLGEKNVSTKLLVDACQNILYPKRFVSFTYCSYFTSHIKITRTKYIYRICA